MSNSALATLLREQAKERREREDEKSSMFGFLRGLDPSFDDRSKPGLGVKSDDPLYNIANMLREMFGEQTEVEKYDSNLEKRLEEAATLSDKTLILSERPGLSSTAEANLLNLAKQQEIGEIAQREAEELQWKEEQWEIRMREAEATGDLAKMAKVAKLNPTLLPTARWNLSVKEEEQRRIKDTRDGWTAFNAQYPHPTSQQIREWRKAQLVSTPFVKLDFIIPALNTAMTSEAVAIQRNYYREGEPDPTLTQQKKMLGEMVDARLTETTIYRLAKEEVAVNQRAKNEDERNQTRMRIALVPSYTLAEAKRLGEVLEKYFREDRGNEVFGNTANTDEQAINASKLAISISHGEEIKEKVLRILATNNPAGEDGKRDIFERTLLFTSKNPDLVQNLMLIRVPSEGYKDGKLVFFYAKDEENAGEFKTEDFQNLLLEVLGAQEDEKRMVLNLSGKPEIGETAPDVEKRITMVEHLLTALHKNRLISDSVKVKNHEGEVVNWFVYYSEAQKRYDEKKNKNALPPDPGSTTVDPFDPELKNLQDQLDRMLELRPGDVGYRGGSAGRSGITRLRRKIADIEKERAIPVGELEAKRDKLKDVLDKLRQKGGGGIQRNATIGNLQRKIKELETRIAFKRGN